MTKSVHAHTREESSLSSQGNDKPLNKKNKKEREGQNPPSQTLANPRKGLKKKKKSGKRKAKAQTAADKRVTERQIINDEEGRLRQVDRHVDTIDMLYRRRQIDGRQRQAACEYRDVAERCGGGIPCPLDASRVRSGGHIPSPTEAQLVAAQTLAEASRILGHLDNQLVLCVACHGMGIEEAAGQVLGRSRDGRVSRDDALHAGRRLRTALTVLADFWWPVGKRAIRGVQFFDAESDMRPAQDGTIEPGNVVHATRYRTYKNRK